MIRIGVDVGGTKIEAAALDARGEVVARARTSSPSAYDDGLQTVAALVAEVEQQAGARAARIGVGGPGSISPRDGLMRNANSTQLNGRPFPTDLERALGRPVRYANDANCLALSEATDGAGEGFGVVFAAILGTGVGAGLTVGGRLIEGRNGVAGEWGHAPLPWPRPEEYPGPACWCGRRGCLERWVSGPALAREAGQPAPALIEALRRGDSDAKRMFEQYVGRLARGLAMVCDILDPDVIVLGGGLSNIEALYPALPAAIAPHLFSDSFETPVRPAQHGDSSGVRGAAWLWPLVGDT